MTMWKIYGDPAQRRGLPTNTPILAIATAVLLCAFAVVVIVAGYGDEGAGALMIGLILTTVPSLIAAAFAERVSRDVRNGVVEHKAKQGARQALNEAGIHDADDQLEAMRAQLSYLMMQLHRFHPESKDE